MNYKILTAELNGGHPVTGDYHADDALAAAELNAVNRPYVVQNITGSGILNATDPAEFGALTDAQKSQWLTLCAVQSIDTSSGVARELERVLFGVGTTTRSQLLGLKNLVRSRAQELGLELVLPTHVRTARK